MALRDSPHTHTHTHTHTQKRTQTQAHTQRANIDACTDTHTSTHTYAQSRVELCPLLSQRVQLLLALSCPFLVLLPCQGAPRTHTHTHTKTRLGARQPRKLSVHAHMRRPHALSIRTYSTLARRAMTLARTKALECSSPSSGRTRCCCSCSACNLRADTQVHTTQR
jgi:hypothetical protein